jgi:hypothetical protein
MKLPHHCVVQQQSQDLIGQKQDMPKTKATHIFIAVRTNLKNLASLMWRLTRARHGGPADSAQKSEGKCAVGDVPY